MRGTQLSGITEIESTAIFFFFFFLEVNQTQ